MQDAYEVQVPISSLPVCTILTVVTVLKQPAGTTWPARQHLSEELRRRRSMLPTLRQRREIGRKHYRAARSAGRPRERKGERTEPPEGCNNYTNSENDTPFHPYTADSKLPTKHSGVMLPTLSVFIHRFSANTVYHCVHSANCDPYPVL